MNDEVVLLDVSERIATITLNRPAARNALSTAVLRLLPQLMIEADSRDDVDVLILTGADPAFCAGLDLTGYGDAPHTENLGAVQRSFAVQKHIAGLISHMRSIPQPIIAAVNGAAAGGGLALVLGSDIRIGAESSKFNVAFIRVGFSACDIGTSWLLPRIVGVARAQEMMLTGRVIDSVEAFRIGLLVDRVADDDLEKVAIAKAEQIMLNTPFGVALTKEAMWAGLEIPAMQTAIDLENRQQIMASRTEDAREAMMAFMEKRPPTYLNR
jgi:enoyl-CoA hydratase